MLMLTRNVRCIDPVQAETVRYSHEVIDEADRILDFGFQAELETSMRMRPSIPSGL